MHYPAGKFFPYYIGPGITSRINFGKTANLFSGLHFAAVPLAGNNTRSGPDNAEFRDYPFGGGFEGRIEERLNLTKWISLAFNGYYSWIYNYEGSPGKSRIGILKPSVTFRFLKNLGLGFEHHIYYDNHFIKNIPDLHLTTTEQKFYLQYFFSDNNRRWSYY